mmetsp:Transcript_57900/g.102381  ORF Transcript_57900/g.102381 Transcript_57900/m.102381 type:complete len:94 (+) Transcript_57900:243-524(+)
MEIIRRTIAIRVVIEPVFKKVPVDLGEGEPRLILRFASSGRVHEAILRGRVSHPSPRGAGVELKAGLPQSDPTCRGASTRPALRTRTRRPGYI